MDTDQTSGEFSLCQLPGKSYERRIETSIVSCSPASVMLERFGKTKPASGAYLDVVLKDTILYAEGGGQACDIGILEVAGAAPLRFPVVDVFPGPSGIVHRVRTSPEPAA
eukprot:CAMPEP_0113701462 /NCGR_PEP_ID=MMETSP0038_2-20120614/24595_1 /TAXON_ID=2898 /ORGANISM="Cryptomonas paramecium" /LENGTH=109 /DNA_ID=CAMNT_0000625371 /DNA_START=116 /DNA_END=442 /DNA_ORIENTATION=- /assembly_acc=CAM_ASM_000170